MNFQMDETLFPLKNFKTIVHFCASFLSVSITVTELLDEPITEILDDGLKGKPEHKERNSKCILTYFSFTRAGRCDNLTHEKLTLTSGLFFRD